MVSILGPVGGSFPVITGAANAYPPSRSQEQLWDGFFARHYQQDRWARRVFMSAGIGTGTPRSTLFSRTCPPGPPDGGWSVTWTRPSRSPPTR